jgi:hypothetical protein
MMPKPSVVGIPIIFMLAFFFFLGAGGSRVRYFHEQLHERKDRIGPQYKGSSRIGQGMGAEEGRSWAFA